MGNVIPVVIALFFVAVFLRIDFYFNIVYLLVAAYLLSRLWVGRAVQQLHAERRFVDRAFPGEEIPVELAVRNAGWLPVPWIKLHDSLPVELANPPFFRRIFSLGTRGEQRFRYALTAHKRGYYEVGPLTLYTGDLLGFVPQRIVDTPSEYLIVYPRVVPLEKLGLPTHSPLVALPAAAPLFEDPARIMGVRPYRAGDSPRQIHWTATATAGELVVKRYQPAIARETLICLDMDAASYAGRRRYDAAELAIVTTASLANHVAVRERLAVGLATQARDPLAEAVATFSLPPRRERAHLMGILEVLARIETVKEPPLPFEDFLRRESLRLSWGTTIVVVTGREPARILAEGEAGPSLLDTLVHLRRSGFAVVLLLLLPETTAEEVERRAAILGVPVHTLGGEKDLEAL